MTPWHHPARLTGLAAPLAVWALHFVALYSLQGAACARGWRAAPVLGLSPLAWSWWLLSLLAFSALAWLGWRAWRTLQTTVGAGDADRAQRFACRLTLLSAAMAAIAVVFTLVPALMLAPCE